MKTNEFIEDWKSEAFKVLKMMNPNVPDKTIKEILDDDVENFYEEPNVTIVNDYVGPEGKINTTLSNIYKFAKNKKPIMAGNGTFFYNQHEKYSPVSDLIVDRMDARDIQKEKMKEDLKELTNYEPNTQEYVDVYSKYEYDDMMNGEAKIRVNSIYGSFGTKTFQLYNRYTAAATTCTGQSLISTTELSFEALLGDNAIFKSMDECIWFVYNTVNDEYTIDYDELTVIDDWKLVYDRLISNFKSDVNIDYNQIESMVKVFSAKDLTKIYYKNNIYRFVDCPVITNIMVNILNKNIVFTNPNKAPEEYKFELEKLWEYAKNFVFYNHAYLDRIKRHRTDNRKTVTYVDTDSNLINVQIWRDYIIDNIVPLSNTELSGKELDSTVINVITYIITNMLVSLLDKYCNDANILEEYKPRINMKNEYLYSFVLYAAAKKRRLGSTLMREGEYLRELEVKGYDFKKAAINEYVYETINGIIENRIVDCIPSVDLPGIYRDLENLESEIEESLSKGERKFLLRMNCKGIPGYKNPYSMGQVLSVLVWNIMFPDDEIMTPDKLDIVLVDIPKVETLDKIKNNFPDEYEKLLKVFDYCPDDPSHTDGMKKIFAEKGIKYFALPNSLDKIPDFIIPFINVEYIKSRNISTFQPILDSLDSEFIGTKQVKRFSNIRQNRVIDF